MKPHYSIRVHIISIVFMTCMLIPQILFADNQPSVKKSNLTDVQIIQETSNRSEGINKKAVKKDISKTGSDLNAFFISGLIVNLIMMLAFAIWAVKQWRKSNKSAKTP